MPDVNAVLAAFRAELVEAGLVRRASEAGAAPIMVIEPVDGPYGPGELEAAGDDGLITTLMHDGDVAPGSNFDAALARTAVLVIRFRSATAADLRNAEALDAAIRTRLIAPSTNYGLGYTLAAATAPLYTQAITVYGGFGPIARSRAQGYDHAARYAVVTAP